MILRIHIDRSERCRPELGEISFVDQITFLFESHHCSSPIDGIPYNNNVRYQIVITGLMDDLLLGRVRVPEEIAVAP